MRPTRIAAALTLVLGLSAQGSASGGIVLFDIAASSTSWAAAVAGLRVQGSWDLDALPDFGVSSIAGPLTASGGGPIPAGFLPGNTSIDASRFFPDEQISLAFIGPSANGLNNVQNAVGPNQPQDSLNIAFSTAVGAFEFNAISCNSCGDGTGLIDISVTDALGAVTVFGGVAAPSSGIQYGLLGTDGDVIRLVNLSGPGPEVPSPGLNQFFPALQGAATVYVVPEPSTFALVGAALFGVYASRRAICSSRHQK